MLRKAGVVLEVIAWQVEMFGSSSMPVLPLPGIATLAAPEEKWSSAVVVAVAVTRADGLY